MWSPNTWGRRTAAGADGASAAQESATVKATATPWSRTVRRRMADMGGSSPGR
jgi:hypothetical protein